MKVQLMTDLEKRTIIDSFKKDLKTLMTKYSFGKKEHGNYNGEDVYCGTDIYLTIDGDEYYAETLSEILDECI
tara:strand:+ start:528 stop:746 length:219 start_codon:yes stop_codon:yes gene_type:complete